MRFKDVIVNTTLGDDDGTFRGHLRGFDTRS